MNSNRKCSINAVVLRGRPSKGTTCCAAENKSYPWMIVFSIFNKKSHLLMKESSVIKKLSQLILAIKR